MSDDEKARMTVSRDYPEPDVPAPGYWERFMAGDTFLLDSEPDPQPLWGDGADVLWSPGEPCLITGPVGVGKTTLVGRLVRGRLGLDRHVLGYKVVTGDANVLYLACDRPRQIARNLARMMAPGDRDTLHRRLVVWTGPPPYDLAKHPGLLLDMAHKAEADTVILDGLKDVALELSKDDVGAGLNQALQKCVADGVEVIGNHHQRKGSSGVATKPRSLSDLYGSTWLGAGAGTVVLVWADRPGQALLTVETLKPSHEMVGPLDVLHDLDTGGLEVHAALDLETLLRTSREPLSIATIAATLGHGDPDPNGREKYRRQLERLMRAGVVDRLDEPRATGGRPEAHYFWRSQ